MSEKMPAVKSITVTDNGVMVKYAGHEERGMADWILDVDIYDKPEGGSYEITYSVCGKCGNREVGEPNEAGMYCRRCGFFMLNGQPGAWPPKVDYIERREPEE